MSAQIGSRRTRFPGLSSLPSFRYPLAALLTLSACTAEDPPPSSEFLLSAGDSTYWVRTDTTGVRVRGSPILLARYGGQFYEVYVTDDDRSFADAMFVGQRIYRRDLVSGDSTLVFEDSVVPQLASSYAAANPGARRLAPDEEGTDEPGSSTTAEITVLDLHGPFLSYDYHVDVEGSTGSSWHSTRRGVLDLRTGSAATLVELFGRHRAAKLTRQARLAYLAAVDSIVKSDTHGARLVAAALRNYTFDESSFGITDLGGAPAIAFHVPGKGSGTAGGITLPLPPISAGDATWWAEVQEGLPTARADSMLERWRRGPIEVAAQYDTAYDGASALLALRQAGRDRAWPLARVQTPIHQIHWLDHPPVDSLIRRGLARAFNDAALYDENVRTAERRREERGKRPALVQLAGGRIVRHKPLRKPHSSLLLPPPSPRARS